MAPRGMITVTTVLLCFLLGLLVPAPAALGSKACCTRYNRKPIPFQLVKGYREQTTLENCRINAIIFYTMRKTEVCATREDKWVRKILELLSSKLKKMSKSGSAAGETQRTVVSPSFYDGGTTETFPSTTESFY